MSVPVPAAPDRFYSCVTILLELAGEASAQLNALGITGLSGEVIGAAKGFLEARNRDSLIQMFIEKGHLECWSKVKDRNSQFFLDNAQRLFGHVQGFDMNIFQDIFRKDSTGKFLLSADLVEDVWVNLDAMIRISINYIHITRKPGHLQQPDGSMANCYYNIFYNDINLALHAQTWGITLNFSG